MDQLHSETVFRGQVVDVALKRYRRSDGSEVDRQVVEHPGAVAIVAHDERVVYLVRQSREAIEESRFLELPAGTLDVEGESELDCAVRELSEEVGLAAERWAPLQVVYPSPGYTNEKITIYEATGLSEKRGEPDEDERIEVVRLPLAELDRVLPELHDAKTLIGLLLLKDKLERDRPG